MKNQVKILSMFAFLLLVSSVFGQMKYGFKVGGSRAGLDGTGLLEAVTPAMKSYTAWSFGVVGELPITDNFSFQPEFAYSDKGFKLDLDDAFAAIKDINNVFKVTTDTTTLDVADLSGINIDVIGQVKYFELPLLAKYTFKGEGTRLYLIGGPTLNYAVSGKLRPRVKIIVNIPLPNVPFDLDLINYQRFELGATVGAGASFPVGTGNIFLDARYSHGLTSIFSINVDKQGLYNQGVQLNAGYIFQF